MLLTKSQDKTRKTYGQRLGRQGLERNQTQTPFELVIPHTECVSGQKVTVIGVGWGG